MLIYVCSKARKGWEGWKEWKVLIQTFSILLFQVSSFHHCLTNLNNFTDLFLPLAIFKLNGLTCIFEKPCSVENTELPTQNETSETTQNILLTFFLHFLHLQLENCYFFLHFLQLQLENCYFFLTFLATATRKL